ncbi:hypothetical protein V6N13_054814 [Hibiscus sabdariffa]
MGSGSVGRDGSAVGVMGLLNDNIVEECEMVSNYNDISWEARIDMTNGNMDAIERDEACKDDQTSFFLENVTGSPV